MRPVLMVRPHVLKSSEFLWPPPYRWSTHIMPAHAQRNVSMLCRIWYPWLIIRECDAKCPVGSMKTACGQHSPMVMMVKTTPKQQTRTYPIHWSCRKQGKVPAGSRFSGSDKERTNVDVAVGMHAQQTCFTVATVRSKHMFFYAGNVSVKRVNADCTW